MTSFLLVTLAGPMAAFGDLAGHERRGSADWAGRSALLGLAGAALGIDRADAAGQAALAAGFGTGLRQLTQGLPLRDFHTFQSVPSALAKAPRTRAAALEVAGRAAETSITIRDYRSDVVFVAAFWIKGPSPRWTLEALQQAFARPFYALWLGRKSCPLAAPLHPRIVTGVTLPDALRADPDGADGKLAELLGPLAKAGCDRIVCDLDETVLPDPLPDGTDMRERFDEPASRAAWTFRARRYVILPEPGKGAAA